MINEASTSAVTSAPTANEFKAAAQSEKQTTQSQATDPKAPQAEAPKIGEAKAEEKKEPSNAERFTLAAKRERALIQEREAIKAEQAKWESQTKEREAQYVAREEKLKALEADFEEGRSNPLAALKKMGWSYQELTDFVLNNEKPTAELEVKRVRDEFGRFKAQIEQDKLKEAEERKKAEEEELKDLETKRSQAMEKFRTDLHSYIKSKADDYELINAYEEHDLVLAIIEEQYNKTGESMEADKAAALAEKYLEDKHMGKLAQTKKFQSRFKQEELKAAEPKAPTPSPSKSLSNNLGTNATSQLPANSEQERIRRALEVASRFKK